MPWGYLTFSAFLVGAVVGSFLNVCIHRLPRDESIVFPPSHCPKCKHRLAPRDLIPVLSWLLLRGRCRYCKKPITPRYAVVEALSGGLFAFTVWHFRAEPIVIVPALVAGAALIVVFFADLETFIVPDQMALAIAASGVGLDLLIRLQQQHSVAFAPLFGSEWARRMPLVGPAVGAVFGGATFALIRAGFSRVYKREAMGLGTLNSPPP